MSYLQTLSKFEVLKSGKFDPDPSLNYLKCIYEHIGPVFTFQPGSEWFMRYPIILPRVLQLSQSINPGLYQTLTLKEDNLTEPETDDFATFVTKHNVPVMFFDHEEPVYEGIRIIYRVDEPSTDLSEVQPKKFIPDDPNFPNRGEFHYYKCEILKIDSNESMLAAAEKINTILSIQTL